MNVCPGCSKRVEDGDTAWVVGGGQVWHASCRNQYQRFYGPAPVDRMRDVPLSTATLMPKESTMPNQLEGAMVANLHRCPPTIDYTITPKRFILDIPVEALANLNADAHTRLLAILNAWITEHTPKPVAAAAKDKP